MSIKNIFWLFIIFSIIISIGTIYASDLTNDSFTSEPNDIESISLSDDVIDLGYSNDLNDKFSSGDSFEIYVNNQSNDGDGSPENPFSNLESACQKANEEPTESITINMYKGIYYMGNNLEFNTNNLKICGIDDGVIIKNMYNNKNLDTKEAFRLTSTNGNITFSNVIFDATDYTVSPFIRNSGKTNFFMPFYGDANLVTFVNCSFLNFTMPIEYDNHNLYSSKFINCYINVDTTQAVLFYNKNYVQYSDNVCPTFDYCSFNLKNINGIADIHLPCNIHVNNSWFGQNTLPKYISNPSGVTKDPGGQVVTDWSVPVNRYAQFSVSENYLGDNKWEIIGKLTWNGTDDQDGMENFQPMTVTLSAPYGNLSSITATLINGSFKVNYTSSASTHHIETKLHNEDNQDLDFYTVNITVNAPSIYYGDDQNVTINFTQPITANITITVSNGTESKNYTEEVINKDSLLSTIPFALKAGTYTIEVQLADNHLWGFNSTDLIVSKYDDYYFEVGLPGVIEVGETATISVTLPSDVNGTVTVIFGNDTQSKDANQTMAFEFTDLNSTSYPVNVTYSGNDKYESKNKTGSVYVNKAQSTIDINDAEFTYGQPIVLPCSTTNAKGVKVRVIKDGEDVTVDINNESSEILIDTLNAGNYTVEVKTIVDTSNYKEATKTINLTIKKADSSVDVDDSYEFEYGPNSVISAVTVNSTGDVIVNLVDANDKEFTATVSGDNITLPVLPVGAYTLNVTTNVDDNHNNATDSAKITIVPATPEVEVLIDPAADIKVNDEVIITVQLPGDATGLVLLEVGDIKLFDELNDEGSVEFTLNNLNAGNHEVIAAYLGDGNYTEAINDTESFTVSKLDNSISVEARPDSDGDVSIYAYLDADEGEATLYINNQEIDSDSVEDGEASFYLYECDKGTYNVTVKYTGEKYADAEGNTTFTVDFGFMYVDYDSYYTVGQNNTMTVELPQDATGEVTLILDNGETFNATVENGKAIIDISSLTEGYYYDATVVYSGDDNYTKRETTIEFEVEPITPEITYKSTIVPGEDSIINITLANATGNVTVTFEGTDYKAELIDGFATITVSNLTLGEWNYMDLYYTGDDNYKPYSTMIDVYVSNIDCPEQITADENATITLTLPEGATGNLTVITDDNTYKTTVENGTATITISDLIVGKNYLEIYYSGDENNPEDEWYKTIEVVKANATITANPVEITQGDTAVIEITLPETATGVVLVDVGGKKAYGDVKDGKSSVSLDGLTAGNYTAEISFTGDEKFNPTSTSTTVNVAPAEDIISELKEIIDAQNNTIETQKDEIAALNDTVVAQNSTIGAQAEQISNLNDTVVAQNSTIGAQAEQISNLNDTVVAQNSTIEAQKGEIAALSDAVVAQNSTIASQAEQIGNLTDAVNDLKAIIDSLKDQNVTVVVDGQEYVVDVVNGTATIKTNKTESKKTSEFTDIVISDDQTISVVLKDGDGNVIANAPITYTVNGKVNATTTDKDGKFTINGENGAIITITYDGNDNITGTNTTLTLSNSTVPSVVKVDTHFNIPGGVITLKGYAVDTKAGEEGIHYATELLDSLGNPVKGVKIQFAVNDKIYNRTTNENGSFNPYKLNMIRAGRYTMAFFFNGDDNYTGTFASVCVDLDKKPIKIKASAKTFKANKKVKYTIALSTIAGSSHDGKAHLRTGKVAKLTLNGKTYSGKTDKNGKVTFKIKNAKKGKFTATINVKEDSTYGEATKKVKLTFN